MVETLAIQVSSAGKAAKCSPRTACVLQLLDDANDPAERDSKGIYQLIHEYGQGLSSKDARLALEYYWQAAAVLGGGLECKVSFGSMYCDLQRLLACCLFLMTLHCIWTNASHGRGCETDNLAAFQQLL